MSVSSNDDSMAKLLGLEVTPLKQDKIAPYRKPTDPTPKQRQLDDLRAIEDLMQLHDESNGLESDDEVVFLRSGLSNRLLKKLRRGDYAIEDHLDLHGLVSDQAKQETHEFINECARDSVRAVCIVHGKGRHSSGRKPVIKNRLIGWLSNNPHVSAVISAPVNDGGTGAVYVLLDKLK